MEEPYEDQLQHLCHMSYPLPRISARGMQKIIHVPLFPSLQDKPYTRLLTLTLTWQLQQVLKCLAASLENRQRVVNDLPPPHLCLPVKEIGSQRFGIPAMAKGKGYPFLVAYISLCRLVRTFTLFTFYFAINSPLQPSTRASAIFSLVFCFSLAYVF